jgi:hypothetical protein
MFVHTHKYIESHNAHVSIHTKTHEGCANALCVCVYVLRPVRSHSLVTTINMIMGLWRPGPLLTTNRCRRRRCSVGHVVVLDFAAAAAAATTAAAPRASSMPAAALPAAALPAASAATAAAAAFTPTAAAATTAATMWALTFSSFKSGGMWALTFNSFKSEGYVSGP